ncbi:MAG TPA: gamma-glutamyltransferase family protein [Candidatus Polarisedimenticolia bacterium]|jgi:gamma-glutamyltranspeptidase/glutathione hydrolase
MRHHLPLPAVALAALVALGASVEQVPPGKVFRPVVRGLHGAVAAGNPMTVEAGLRMLRGGGNAVDAGVAATFAAAVTEFSHFGMGGEASILIYLQKPDRVVAVNADGPAPMLATPDLYLEKGGIPATGILSATVPAAVDGLLLALREHGTLRFEEVIQPAIEYADGFPMSEFLSSVIASRAEAIRQMPGSAAVFLPGGAAPRPGEVFRQPDLARTLRGMAAAEREAGRKGREAGIDAVRDHFYRGPIAAAIGAASERAGGLLRAADLAAYHARLEPSVSVPYRGWEVHKVGFWSQGPAMLETLNILEGYPLKGMGLNSADYVHTVVEAMKLAFADRDRYYGDPAFVHVPAEALLSKTYAEKRRALIDKDRASLRIRPGDPGELGMASGAKAMPGLTGPPAPPDHAPLGTTCINIVDAQGNLWSATPSGAWLPSVVAGETGIPLSQRMQAFSLAPGHANRLAPGKLPRYTLTPTIARRPGERPSLAFSTPGLDVQDQTLLQVFLNIAEFGMTLQEAVEAPRFDSLHLEETFDQHRVVPGGLRIEGRVPDDVIAVLRERGHVIELLGAWAHASAPTIVSINRENGVLSAAADPRRDRYAFAY